MTLSCVLIAATMAHGVVPGEGRLGQTLGRARSTTGTRPAGTSPFSSRVVPLRGMCGSGCHSNHGVWEVVEDEAHPPAFNPGEAAQRVPPEQWQQVVRRDSHGKVLVHYVAELELGTAYGPRQAVRLIAATTDSVKLKKDATWYLITTLPLQEASPQEVYVHVKLPAR